MTTLRISRGPGFSPDTFTVKPGKLNEILKQFFEEHPEYSVRENGIVRLNEKFIPRDKHASTTAGPRDAIRVSGGEVHTLDAETWSKI